MGRFLDHTSQNDAMNAQGILDRLVERFGTAIVGSDVEALDPWIGVSAEALAEIARFLRDDADLRFDQLNCISGVDYLQTDPKKKADYAPHLELLYHLTSLVHKHRIVLRLVLPRWKDDVPGELPEVPTVSQVWRTADWHEREVFDLIGVRFVGHRDLRRILCPEDWKGHPLRKDYEMPLEYHGIRGR
jgi:NADH-quinone oxidoreductase subunit C